MSDTSATPSYAEVRRQLERMLQSRVFTTRPRSAAMLRYFVEESIRNGFAPLDQEVIATRGLGLDGGVRPGRNAEVRARVARLREVIGRYYSAMGPEDPVVFDVVQEPYRLVPTSNGSGSHGTAAGAARRARQMLPLLVVVEPEVSGMQRPDLLAQGVSLLLISLLVKSQSVTVSGLLRRDRIAAAAGSAASLARSLGYEYVVQSEIHAESSRCEARMTITATNLGEPVAEVANAFDPWDPDSLPDDIAGWMQGHIDAALAP